jgi:lipoprotein-anchoring transpeptidase ErfK/SrfK
MAFLHNRTVTSLAAGIAAAILVAGCTSSNSQLAAPEPGPSTQGLTATLTISPAANSRDVNPTAPVTVEATDGSLNSVAMTNDEGKEVAGIMTPDRLAWKSSEPLGYNKKYLLEIVSQAPTGTTSSRATTFSTIAPPNQTKVYLTDTAGNLLVEDGSYGVGTVVVAHFDESITDRATAERQLTVTTDPPVTGSWFWVDDQNAHWRPESYFAPGTHVTATASMYGVEVGDGLFGEEDSTTSFVVGNSRVSVVDDATKQVSVYEDGTLVRTMPTSLGMGGSEVVNGQTISFWTQPGTYTVMDRANPVVMDSSTYGLPVNSRLGYKETINYATRISTDGIYLHQLDSTVWAQGNTNVSHGCLNLNAENAQWFYNFSQPGDVVEVRNTGGAPLEVWQNGDWSVPWSQWLAGSAAL